MVPALIYRLVPCCQLELLLDDGLLIHVSTCTCSVITSPYRVLDILPLKSITCVTAKDLNIILSISQVMSLLQVPVVSKDKSKLSF